MDNTTWKLPKVELYVHIDVVEKEDNKYNHLLSVMYQNREMLIAATGSTPAGVPGQRVWVKLHDVTCLLVITQEEVMYKIVSGKTWLCNGDLP